MSEKLRILYVDDSTVQLDAFRRSLANGDYEVCTVSNPRDAPEQLNKFGPSLVVIDYLMPQMSGGECLQLLKRSARGEAPRYYLYTTDPDAFRRHREMGFDGVLMLKGKTSVRSQIDAIARSLQRFRG